MIEERSNLVTSDLSPLAVTDGYVFSIEICQLEGDTTWTLEGVHHEGTSFIWKDEFPSYVEALCAVVKALCEEGA